VLDAEINVIGSLRVLRGRSAGARKVVFASSGGPYTERDQLPVRSLSPKASVALRRGQKAVGDYLFAYRELHGIEYTPWPWPTCTGRAGRPR